MIATSFLLGLLAGLGFGIGLTLALLFYWATR